jgi:hypothetical protein
MEMEILQKSFQIENSGSSGLLGIVASLGGEGEDDDD